jgi:SAM-dependent methyltransferase
MQQNSSATAFKLSSFARSPKFPAHGFTCEKEFKDYLAVEQGRLDARYSYEQSLATREALIIQRGTCAPCLQVTNFSSSTESGERLKDGRFCPSWREAMQCDCEDRLSNRERAVLHFVMATGILPWMKLLLLGGPNAVDRKLAALAAETTAMRPFSPKPEPQSFHMAVSQDYLHHIPHLGAALEELCRQLVEGGRFIFTVPFHHTESQSTLIDLAGFSGRVPAEFQGATHRLGWDLLDMLRQAGFREAAAYLYWSEELGYLGPMNFVFRAMK